MALDGARYTLERQHLPQYTLSGQIRNKIMVIFPEAGSVTEVSDDFIQKRSE